MEEERTYVCIELKVNGQVFVHFGTADENLSCCSPSILNQSKKVKSALRYCLARCFSIFFLCGDRSALEAIKTKVGGNSSVRNPSRYLVVINLILVSTA